MCLRLPVSLHTPSRPLWIRLRQSAHHCIARKREWIALPGNARSSVRTPEVKRSCAWEPDFQMAEATGLSYSVTLTLFTCPSSSSPRNLAPCPHRSTACRAAPFPRRRPSGRCIASLIVAAAKLSVLMRMRRAVDQFIVRAFARARRRKMLAFDTGDLEFQAASTLLHYLVNPGPFDGLAGLMLVCDRYSLFREYRRSSKC